MFKKHFEKAILKSKEIGGLIKIRNFRQIPESRSRDKTVGDFSYP